MWSDPLSSMMNRGSTSSNTTHQNKRPAPHLSAAAPTVGMLKADLDQSKGDIMNALPQTTRDRAEITRRSIKNLISVDDCQIALVGSTFIVGKGHDFDFLVITSDINTELLRELGFERDLSDELPYDYESTFESWRLGEINLLMTTNPEYFIAEVAAATAARLIYESPSFNMNSRSDRVKFHKNMRSLMTHYVEPKVGQVYWTLS